MTAAHPCSRCGGPLEARATFCAYCGSPAASSAAEAPGRAPAVDAFTGTRPASLPLRGLAYLVDATLLTGVSVAAWALGLLLLGSGMLTLGPLLVVLLTYLLLAGVIWLVQGSTGRTPGKALAGLRLVRADTAGRPGAARALARYVVLFPTTWLLGLGWFSPLFDGTRRNRGWHDRAAGTAVLDVRRGRDPARSGPPLRAAEEAASGLTPVVSPLPTAASGPASRPEAGHRAVSTPEPTPGSWQSTPDPTSTGGAWQAAWPPAASPDAEPAWGGASTYDPADPFGLRSPATPAPTAAERPPAPRPDPGPQPAELTPDPALSLVPALPDRTPARSTAAATPGGVIDAVPGLAVPPVAAPRPSTPAPPRTAPDRAEPALAGWSPPDLGGAPSDLTDPIAELDRTRPRAAAPAPGRPGEPVTLTFDDGTARSVTGRGLIGRDPEPRPGEQVEHLLALTDDARSVSKTHLAFGVDADGLWVTDRASINGTVVVRPDGTSSPARPGEQVRVPSGATVRLGDRSVAVGPR